MKRIVTVLAVVIAACITASAQDIITKKDGNDIMAKVLEVNPNDVKYVLSDEPDGPVYTIRKNELLMIRYASGRNELFNNASPYAPVPNLKYKELKTMYNYQDYTPMAYDRYSPGWLGFASFAVPGLGQMICDEVGRGFAWFGASAGCAMISGIGLGLIGDGLTTYHDDYGDTRIDENTGALVVGRVLTCIGGLASLAVEIAAIVDAVRVAKVKNMYDQDMRNNYSLDVNIYPSFNYTHTANGIQPTAGLTLAMRF